MAKITHPHCLSFRQAGQLRIQTATGRLFRFSLFLAIAVLTPGLTYAGGEAAEVAQMFQDCINSGGRAASDYNAWVAQKGCICPGQSTGSGQRTCAGPSSSTPGGSNSSLMQQSTEAIGQGLMHGDSNLFGLGVLGVILSNPPNSQTNANDEARRQAEEVARQAAQKRREADKARKLEASKERLLGESSESGSNSLGLMGAEPQDHLQLMTDSPDNPTPGQHSDAFNKGFKDASQCYSQNAGPFCSGLTGDQWQTCLSDYRSGYQIGDKHSRQSLEEAYEVGRQQGGQGAPANAESDPRSLGPCRTQWIESYNRGYWQAKRPIESH